MTVYGTKIMMKDEQLTKIITVPIFITTVLLNIKTEYL